MSVKKGERRIQGLHSEDAEGSYYALLARVLLGNFKDPAKVKEKPYPSGVEIPWFCSPTKETKK